jgi:predicted CoA-binding protein
MRSVEEFLKQNKWAFVGATDNKKKFGSFAYQELKKKGIALTPVNPRLTKLENDPVYSSLSALPNPVDAVLIAVSPSKTIQVVEEAHNLGVRHIWMQRGAESRDAVAFCKEKEINCISGECILMFADPAGIHRFHRLIWKLLGKMPK